MYNPNQKFNEAKEKLIQKAANLAANYFSTKFGSAKFSREPKVELTHQNGPTSDSYTFSGTIKCYSSTPILNHEIEVGMTVNNNDVSVESESTVGDNIVKALNASEDYLPTEDVVTANLKDFRLIDSGDNKYLKVAHPALEDAEIGIVSKAEYETSPNKAELLKSIVTDSIARTASYNYKLEFTGNFVEPKIEKYAEEPLPLAHRMADPIVEEEESLIKSDPSWLSDLDEVGNSKWCPECNTPNQFGEMCQDCQEEFERVHGGKLDPEASKTISISENMPRAKMSGGVEQAMQAEQQKLVAEKDKLSNTAVNQLIPTLQSLGFGSARVSEITPNLSHSDNGFDGSVNIMAFLEDKTSTKLVNFPIKIVASKVELPKKPLISELIEKAVDINQRLTEQLTKEALLSLADVDARVEYEKQTVESILKDEFKIEKTATENGLSGVQLLGPQSTISLQKHLLPLEAQDMAVGDCVFGDGQYYRLVDKEGNQNDKNSESSSLWKFVVCEPPKEKEEPTIRIPE